MVRYSILKKYLRYNTDTRYRNFYRVPVSICYVHSLGATIILTCVLIVEFPIKFNGLSLFTAVCRIAFGWHAQVAYITFKYLYLLPDGSTQGKNR